MNHPLDAYDQYAALIGRVVISWNEVQWVIYRLFVEFSEMPEPRAHDVFFKLRSDASQRGITLAAGKTALATEPALWERLRATVGALDSLAGERNATVHTMWGFNFFEALTGETQLIFGPMAGRHNSLMDDFPAQCDALRKELQDHFSALFTILQQFNRRK